MKKFKKLFSIPVLFIFPVIFLFLGLNFNRNIYGFDPEYAYLMNGLVIDNIDYVKHVDNPGTTVQIYSAIVLKAVHLFRKSEELNKDVLHNPDLYIEAGRKGLIILNSLMILALGLLILFFTKNLLFSLTVQITPFLSSNVLEHAWARFSPEPMLVIGTGFFIIVLILYYFRNSVFKSRLDILFGISAGFGLATKATFLPVFLIPLILLNNKSERKKYLLSVFLAFVFFTIPAIPSYHLMLNWFIRLFTHTGVYGQGEAGIINFSKYFSDFFMIIKNNIILTVSILSGIIILVNQFIRIKNFKTIMQNQVLRIIFSILVAQLFGVIMVAKHYHANHYLLPVIALTGAMLFFILYHIITHLKSELIKILVPALVFGCLIVLSAMNIPHMKYADYGYVLTNEETTKFEELLVNDYKDYKKITCSDRINKFSSLRWGSSYSKSKFIPLINEYYPDAAFFDQNNQIFASWNEEFSFGDFIKKYGKKLLIYDGPTSDEEFARWRSNGVFLNKRYKGRVHNIYELDTIDSRISLQQEFMVVWQKTFDPDSVTSDQQYFVCKNEKITNNYHRNNEVFYSGLYCAKMEKDNNFAFDYQIPDVQTGQLYQLTLWVKSEGEHTQIVASSINPGEFWAGSQDVVATGIDGWRKIRLRFHVPEGLTKGLKTYIWNTSAEKVYMDDFTITRLK
jgi:hypothetical protein